MNAMPGLGTVLTAIVTPFDERLRVDEEAFVALGRHLLDHGSDGLVVAGSTGESATLTDDEQIGLIELAVRELGTHTIVAGAGSNDTRHAVALTERATEAGAHAILSVTPYYNRPSRRGLIAHFSEVARATDRPVVLYNIPIRTGLDMPNELLAELAQIERIDYVKQANDDSLAPIDGLGVYAGNDGTFARTLDMGGAGGILVASHVVGDELARMVSEPENRAAIDASLHEVFETLFATPNPIGVKAALNLLGLRAGGLRLPMVEASEDERAHVRAMLERRGLLGAPAGEVART
jgi:4-hydroxy-tetrahydrodipicolinate synthase